MSYKVGDRVYIKKYRWAHEMQYLKGEITKITPSGLTDVKTGTVTRRFSSAGREQSAGSGRAWRIDDMPFEERRAELRKRGQIESVVVAINYITPLDVKPEWGLEKLDKEIERLQGLLDEAKALSAKAKEA